MVRSVSPEQAHDLISRGEVEVIDVREPNEWSTGHLAGARLVPLAQFRANPGGAPARWRPLRVRRGCAQRDGGALGLVARLLEGLQPHRGTRSWTKAGMPLVQELSVAV